jgi:hypothetical protein
MRLRGPGGRSRSGLATSRTTNASGYSSADVRLLQSSGVSRLVQDLPGPYRRDQPGTPSYPLWPHEKVVLTLTWLCLRTGDRAIRMAKIPKPILRRTVIRP